MSDQGARQGGRFEKHIYYRRPRSGENAGWITMQGTNLNRQTDMTVRGFEPMPKYGTFEDNELRLRRENKLGPDEPMNQWRPILEHPDGPAEFPVQQVMDLRWYKPEDCPVPGTKFPQLGGHSIVEYRCPECSRFFVASDGFGGIEPLARHLRLIHSWDRASLVKYGEKVNIDFDAIYSSIETAYEFSGAPVAEHKSSGFDCPDCTWTPKANQKRPAQALAIHAKEHEMSLEVVG
jgi:hypothetical protein